MNNKIPWTVHRKVILILLIASFIATVVGFSSVNLTPISSTENRIAERSPISVIFVDYVFPISITVFGFWYIALIDHYKKRDTIKNKIPPTNKQLNSLRTKFVLSFVFMLANVILFWLFSIDERDNPGTLFGNLNCGFSIFLAVYIGFPLTTIYGLKYLIDSSKFKKSTS